jgi:hypothetical protein
MFSRRLSSKLPCVALACVAAGLAGCGGRDASMHSAPAATDPDSTPSCASRALTLSAATVLASANDIPGSPLALAATPAGDRFFVTWSDAYGPRAAVVGVDAQEGASVTPVDVAGLHPGSVVYDGTGFTTFLQEEGGLGVRRFDADGNALGPATTLLPTIPIGLSPVRPILTDAGIVVTWVSDGAAPASGSPVPPALYATLVDSSGTVIQNDALLPAQFDKSYGTPPLGAVAVVAGSLLLLEQNGPAGSDASMIALPWLGAQVVPGQVPAGRFAGGWPLMVTNGELAFAMIDPQGDAALYTGPPGGPFAASWSLPADSFALDVDGCGRIVDLAPGSGGAVLAASSSVAPGSSIVGTLAGGARPAVAAIAGTTTGFGVAWTDETGTLEFATLAWQ